MILISTLTAVMFFGGWQAPIDGAVQLAAAVRGWCSLPDRLDVPVIRATFPRYRYDQIMRLGWKIFIPITLVWITLIGIWMQTPWSLWK